MTVEAIKDAIQHLPEEERASLAAWLNDLEYDAWDKEMAHDLSPRGRASQWAEQLKREAAQPENGSLAEGFRRRPNRRS